MRCGGSGAEHFDPRAPPQNPWISSTTSPQMVSTSACETGASRLRIFNGGGGWEREGAVRLPPGPAPGEDGVPSTNTTSQEEGVRSLPNRKV